MKSINPLLNKKNPTVKEAILIWLITHNAEIVRSSSLEVHFKEFLFATYGKVASASNISRRWRELKGYDGLLLATEVGKSPEGEWLLLRYGDCSWEEWKTKQRSLAYG